jgi:hypothetical protein
LSKFAGSKTAAYKGLHGMTAEQIHAKAEENRTKRAEKKP